MSSTGEVFIPYVGNVRVAGMSPSHARETIQEKLTSVSPSVQVQLELTQSLGSMVSLVGGCGQARFLPHARPELHRPVAHRRGAACRPT
ncbi:hypothetical protein Rumeso_01452 [Rubellimicrobium mesophilum DSM 19309]|uniref:Polysaccharide export protein N-terminal domain-containing protein n=1 Tax=Rubellimicrobium mesophilum DSM 19309 TaxID=442562 RepID=A0A017HRH7_9RHOB|nr:polysaccharide biosynthesis/export family protein [Rubellimicrobium mesophilum]EYD76930.1 hypothetical protein Rumeso_01452 [Rubellimicrobium mesophilum DSM 19309]